jgi:oxalate decarboxylase
MASNQNPAPHHETPTLGNPDLPPEGMQTTAGDPAGAKMTGPQNPVLENQFPNQIKAPATDISTQPFFWSSFNISPRRQQAGGWAREVTQPDFAISDEIAGVNMYLEPGRHPRAALAPDRRVGDHDAGQVPGHDPQP